MNERQKDVLAGVIYFYLKERKPVGSKMLQKNWMPAICSATVRREMHELEKKGYLSKPHTSSGRVPTEQGWRFYVTHLLPHFALSPKDRRQLLPALDRNSAPEELIQAQLRRLSQYLQAVSLLSLSHSKGERIQKLEALPMGREVLFILITERGAIHQARMVLSDEATSLRASRAIEQLNKELCGKSFYSIYGTGTISLGLQIAEAIGLSSPVMERLLSSIFAVADQTQIYVEGASFLIEAEGSRTAPSGKLLRLLEERSRLGEILSASSSFQRVSIDGDIEIAMGSQLPETALKNFSLMTSHLGESEQAYGTLGVLSPINTHYAKAVASLKTVRDFLHKQLQPVALS